MGSRIDSAALRSAGGASGPGRRPRRGCAWEVWPWMQGTAARWPCRGSPLSFQLPVLCCGCAWWI